MTDLDENKKEEQANENIDDANIVEETESSEDYEDVIEESIIVDNYIDEKDSYEIKKREIELSLQQLDIKIDSIEFGATDIEDLSDEELVNDYALGPPVGVYQEGFQQEHVRLSHRKGDDDF